MIRVSRRRATSLPAWLLLGLCSGAMAHEGHHDEGAPSPVPVTAPMPHATASTPQIEAVAQREGRDVVLYLDDYASNAPLDGLQVSLRSGALTAQAAGGEGRYVVPAELLPAGVQTLELSVHGAGLEAQLQVELPAAAGKAAPAPAKSPSAESPMGALTVIVVTLLAAWLLRRRRVPRAVREAGAA